MSDVSEYNEYDGEDNTSDHNKPPKGPKSWLLFRKAQSHQALHNLYGHFDIGNEEIIKKAVHICEQMHSKCFQHFKYYYDIGIKTHEDALDGHYDHLGNPSLWACLALQQAFGESNQSWGFVCSNAEDCPKWSLKNLRDMLVTHNGGKFFEINPDDSMALMTTSAGGSRDCNAAHNLMTNTNLNKTTRRIIIHSFGDGENLKKKLETFACVFRVCFGYDVYPGIKAGRTPEPMQFTMTGATKSGTAKKLVTSWGSRVKHKAAAAASARTYATKTLSNTVSSNSIFKNSIAPRNQNTARKQSIKIVSTVEKKQHTQHLKQLANEDEVRQKADAERVNSLDDIRGIATRDFKNELIQDIIAHKAHEARIEREHKLKHDAKQKELDALNQRIESQFRNQQQNAILEYNNLEQERVERANEKARVEALYMYVDDGIREIDHEKYAALSEYDKKIADMPPVPDQIDTHMIRHYNRTMPKLDTDPKPTPKHSELSSYPKTPKDQIFSKPGEFVDYACVFKLDQQEAENLTKRISRRELQCLHPISTEVFGFENWQVWLYYMTCTSNGVGLPPRMKQDIDKNASLNKRKAASKQRAEERRVVKLTLSSSARNQDAVDDDFDLDDPELNTSKSLQYPKHPGKNATPDDLIRFDNEVLAWRNKHKSILEQHNKAKEKLRLNKQQRKQQKIKLRNARDKRCDQKKEENLKAASQKIIKTIAKTKHRVQTEKAKDIKKMANLKNRDSIGTTAFAASLAIENDGKRNPFKISITQFKTVDLLTDGLTDDQKKEQEEQIKKRKPVIEKYGIVLKLKGFSKTSPIEDFRWEIRKRKRKQKKFNQKPFNYLRSKVIKK